MRGDECRSFAGSLGVLDWVSWAALEVAPVMLTEGARSNNISVPWVKPVSLCPPMSSLPLSLSTTVRG